MKPPKHQLYSLLIAVFLLLSTGLKAVEPEYSLDFITVEEGLSQSTVNALAQDDKGFLWIGTQDGLNYFDGHQFKVFKKDPFDPSSLSDNHITSILIDRNNQLWVGTIRGGLNKFDSQKQQFTRFVHQEKKENSLSSDWVVTQHEDQQGNIWVGTTSGLNRLINREDGTYAIQRYFLTDSSSGKRDNWEYITAIQQSKEHELLVGSLGGFYRLILDKDLNQTSFEWRPVSTGTNRLVKVVTSFFALPSGEWLIGTTNGLYLWDGLSKNYEFIELPGMPGNASRIEINKMLSNDSTTLMVATVEGVFQLNLQQVRDNGLQIYPAEHSSWDFQTPVILDFLYDKLHPGLIWLGTNLSGLVKLYPRQIRFSTNYLYQVSHEHGVSPSVFHLFEDKEQQLWIGLEGGILIKNEMTGAQKLYRNIQIGKKTLPTRYIRCYYKDSSGNIWAGTPNGLLKLFLKGGMLHGQLFTPPEDCDNWLVLSIYEDGPYLYLGSIGGIFLFDKENEAFTGCPVPINGMPQYSAQKDESKLHRGFRITAMHRDQQDRLWVGCANGLFLFPDIQLDRQHTDTKQVAAYYYQHPKQRNSLSDNMVNQVLEDNEGQIWIATMNGIAKAVFKNKTLQFQNYYEKDGLANNVVYGILAEPKGEYLWLSTNNGLSRFHPQTEQFFNYKKSDGLQSSEFNANAFHSTTDGKLLFGGIKGYTSFRPEEVAMSTYQPPVWITSLTTFKGNQYNLIDGNSNTPVVLDHSENSFAVNFTGLDYLHPTEVEYYYDLEGGTAKDVHIGQHRKIEFNQLAPGKYNLCVKAKGKDGIVNAVGDNLEIHILTPYWQQSWFYWLCAGGILLISSLIYHTFYKIKMAQITEIEKVRKAAAEDFHDELGSKLSIISMFSELTRAHLSSKDTQVATYLDRITVTSGSLYESMRDMLWALNPEQDTIRDLFFQLKDFGEELFSHTNIAFHSTGIQPGWSRQNLPMQYKRHVLLMCKEALHNSLRHANPTHVSLQMSYQRELLKLEIQDDGNGFDLDQIERGEGITNMETRARRINGTFNISSNGTGTCITITCPLV